MVENNKTGFLYRYEDVEMLTYYIDKVLSMNEIELTELSQNERTIALKRHDPIINKERMIEIYNNVCNNNN